MDRIIVTILGTAGIAFTYWFFLMKKEKKVSVEDFVDIIVDGGYMPEAIVIAKDKTIKIYFFRKDPSPCFEEVALSDFKIRKFLPLNKKVTIEITPKKVGEFNFSCGMNMFHGKIIVK